MEEAIAAAYEVKITQVRSAMMLTGNLAEVSTLAHRHQLEEARMRLFHPLGFMLASPVDSVEEALERFSPGAFGGQGEQSGADVTAEPSKHKWKTSMTVSGPRFTAGIRSSPAEWPCFRDPARI